MANPIPPAHGSLAFLPHMERNIGSLYTSLDTLLATEQFETALHLAGSLYPYWETYENLSEGVEWLHRLVGTDAGERFRGSSLSNLYSMLGNLLRHQSEYERATTYYELGLACLSEKSDYKVHTFILGGLGEIAFRQGRYEDARSMYQSYLEVGRQADDHRYVADAFNALGRLANVKGEFAEAWEYHHAGRHLCEENNYPTGLAWMFNALGELDRSRGEYLQAIEHFQESAAIFNRLGNSGARMLALQNLAFALLQDHTSDAEPLLQTTLRFWQRGPARHGMSLSMIGLSRVDLARGNLTKARRQVSTASQILDQIGVQLELGDRGDYEIAVAEIKKALGRDAFLPPGGSEPRTISPRNLLKTTALTGQELTVIRLVAQGFSDKQIAAQLVISPHTVNAHLKSIYRKLSVRNRTAAVTVARSRHIL